MTVGIDDWYITSDDATGLEKTDTNIHECRTTLPVVTLFVVNSFGERQK